MPSSTTRPGTLAWGRAARARRAQSHAAGPAAELQRHAQALGHPREDGQVEVHHVPARQHVRVQIAHAAREPGDELPL
jgi:hypothetical protein